MVWWVCFSDGRRTIARMGVFMLRNQTYGWLFLLLMPLLIFSFFVSRPVAGEEATLGLTPEQIEEIESKLAPVFKGKPVSEIAEADRPLLFLAEGLFPESYDLFFRHGEYLATEKRSFTEAIPRLKKALDLKPKDLPSLELLAQCHTELKQASEEVACWETLRELIEEDDTEETRDLRERITFNLGRMAEENEMTMRKEGVSSSTRRSTVNTSISRTSSPTNAWKKSTCRLPATSIAFRLSELR